MATRKSKSKAVSGQASTVTAEGLAATLATLEAEKSKSEAQRERDAARAVKQRDSKLAKLTDLANGTNNGGGNAKLHHNPQLSPETLRPTTDGEMIGGKPAKGWVVTICCATCSTEREINTQDAFQVRFCSKACKPKGSSKSKINKRATELASLSVEELQAQIDAIKAA